MVKRAAIFAAIFYTILAVSACELFPGSSLASPQQQTALYTQAVQTAYGEITQTAQVASVQQTIAAQTEAALLNFAVQTLSAQQTASAALASRTPTVLPPTDTPLPPPPTATTDPSTCNRADFLADLSPTHSLIYIPGEVFRKKWRFQNVGTCTWTPGYRFLMINGPFQGSIDVPMPGYVRPGQTVDVSVTLVAPRQPGSYTGYWNLSSSTGQLFGFGPLGEDPLTVQVIVQSATEIVPYNFARNYCSAQWRTGISILTCGSLIDEENGLVALLEFPVTERGPDTGPGMWTHPNNSNNGFITGVYPPVLVRRGDRLLTTVGCLADSPGCDVIFQIEYEIVGSQVNTLGRWRETSDGRLNSVNIDLSFLDGYLVRFIFTVMVQNNQPQDAQAVWLAPKIDR